MPPKQQIQQLIAEDRIEQALNLLKEYCTDQQDANTLLLLTGQFNRLQRDKGMGMLRFEEENITRNRIVAGLLNLAETIKDIAPASKPDGSKKLRAFISYAHADEAFRKKLETYLSMLKRDGQLETWSDREILPGADWKQEISQNLESAELIIFLVSADFLASDYYYDIELKRAIARQKAGTTTIIPIIVRHCAWTDSPIGGYQALPREGKPINAWPTEDEAWLDVYQGIKKLIGNL